MGRDWKVFLEAASGLRRKLTNGFSPYNVTNRFSPYDWRVILRPMCWIFGHKYYDEENCLFLGYSFSIGYFNACWRCSKIEKLEVFRNKEGRLKVGPFPSGGKVNE